MRPIDTDPQACSAICCPDKFRGSLGAPEAAARMAEGLGAEGIVACELPLADGGEGTLDTLLSVLGGTRQAAVVTGPLGGSVTAEWGILEDGTGVIEAAQAAGLSLVGSSNDPVGAATTGVGELIRIAFENGVRRAIVCVGGSATTDGGTGAVEALGWTLPDIELTVACDVTTTFLDAARVFGPQKGATATQVEELTERLREMAEIYRQRTSIDVVSLPGSGAAGGLAGGLAALGATLERGFDVVASAVGLTARLRGARVVMTGEGRIDATSFSGKVVGGVLERSDDRTRRFAVAGEVTADALAMAPADVELYSLVERAGSPEDSIARAGDLLAEVAHEVGRRLVHH